MERCVDKESRVQGLLFRDIDHSMELKTLKNKEIVQKFKKLKITKGTFSNPGHTGNTPPKYKEREPTNNKSRQP